MVNQNLVDDAVISALSVDSCAMNPADPEAFINANRFQYRLSINMWIRLLDLNVRDELLICRYISTEGLLAVISQANAYAESLINNEADSSNIFSQFTSIPKDARNKRVTLERLRFLKRFSVAESSTLKSQSLQDFSDWEEKTAAFIADGFEYKSSDGEYCYHSEAYPSYICRELKKIINQYLLFGCYRWGQWKELPSKFSSGSTRDAGACLTDKLCTTVSSNPDIVYHRYNMPMFTDQGAHNTALISAVPKTYKSYRIIAMEDAVTQYSCSRAQDYLHKIVDCHNEECKQLTWKKIRWFTNNIPLFDQQVNIDKVRESWNGSSYEYATIDLSHASDSISKVLLSEIWPTDIVDVLSMFSTYVQYKRGGREYRMQTASTAGHCLTFVVESIVFCAIVTYCYDVWNALSCDDDKLPYDYHVYGDDIVVHTQIAPFVMELLERLGFKVNPLKSHFMRQDAYRETCGGEFWRGVDLSTHYWPRAYITNSKSTFRSHEILNDSLTSLCSLQRRLFAFSKEHPSMTGISEAYLYLESVILKIEPRMTYSRIEDGETASDLFGPDCLIKTKALVELPDGSIPTGALREVHLTPRVIYNQLSDDARNSRSGVLMLWHEIDAKYLYDLVRYEDFLKHGPYYADGLDELLHVSSQKWPTYQAASSTPRIVWTEGLR